MTLTLTSKLPRVGTTIFTVMSRLAAEHGAINLSQGFPDFDPPARLVDLVAEHMRRGLNQYAPMAGWPALRQQIVGKVREYYGATVDAETEVTVTSGGTEALFAAIQAVVRPGDEVIVLDPAYDSYEPAVELAGGVTVHVPLGRPDFAVDWDRVRDAITPRTRLLIVNTPHNPSGAVFGPSDLDALADVLSRTDAFVLSDEVYEHMVFDGRPHLSLLGRPDLAARSFVVSSFGKTFHATGWKIGYCVAPAPLRPSSARCTSSFNSRSRRRCRRGWPTSCANARSTRASCRPSTSASATILRRRWRRPGSASARRPARISSWPTTPG